MDFRTIEHTGMRVSALSFGASSLGGVFHTIDEGHAIEALHTAVEGGMNFIDVSPYYGHYRAEAVLGKALRTVTRDRYWLSTKGKGSGITPDEWAPKLIGRTKQGEMVFGYASLPYVDYRPAMLSARRPWYDKEAGAVKVSVENYGLSASKPAEIAVTIEGKSIGTTTIGALAPYARTTATLSQATLEKGTCEVTATVDGKATLLGKFAIQP